MQADSTAHVAPKAGNRGLASPLLQQYQTFEFGRQRRIASVEIDHLGGRKSPNHTGAVSNDRTAVISTATDRAISNNITGLYLAKVDWLATRCCVIHMANAASDNGSLIRWLALFQDGLTGLNHFSANNSC